MSEKKVEVIPKVDFGEKKVVDDKENEPIDADEDFDLVPVT